MKPAASFDRFWYVPAPAERLALLRILVGAYALVYLLVRYVSLSQVTRFQPPQFDPVGPVRLLSEPVSASSVHGVLLLAIVAGAAFIVGFKTRYAAPLFALTFLWVTSYKSSWGMKFHTENLVALHLLLLAAAPTGDALSWDAHARKSSIPEPHGRYGWAIRALCAVTVITYVLAGVAKLRLAGVVWADGEILRTQVAYDNLRKIELGSLHSPLGALLAAHAWPFVPLAFGTLLLELCAPLALFSRTVARFWVGGVFLFHVGVLLLMAIAFPYQLSFVAYLSFFPIERLQGSRFYEWIHHRVQTVVEALDHRSMARDRH